MPVEPVLHFLAVEVPFGLILLVARGARLARAYLGPDPGAVSDLASLARRLPSLAAEGGSTLLTQVARMVRRYFAGYRVDFSQVPLDLDGSTEFQRAVWTVACTIPYGSTRSYGWVAAHLQGRGCPRAVGQALARNPLPLVIPCHRVIEESGARGGFTAGEGWKDLLLEIEGGEQRLRLRERRVRRGGPSRRGAEPPEQSHVSRRKEQES